MFLFTLLTQLWSDMNTKAWLCFWVEQSGLSSQSLLELQPDALENYQKQNCNQPDLNLLLMHECAHSKRVTISLKQRAGMSRPPPSLLCSIYPCREGVGQWTSLIVRFEKFEDCSIWVWIACSLIHSAYEAADCLGLFCFLDVLTNGVTARSRWFTVIPVWCNGFVMNSFKKRSEVKSQAKSDVHVDIVR